MKPESWHFKSVQSILTSSWWLLVASGWTVLVAVVVAEPGVS